MLTGGGGAGKRQEGGCRTAWPICYNSTRATQAVPRLLVGIKPPGEEPQPGGSEAHGRMRVHASPSSSSTFCFNLSLAV
eukprot:4187843-Pyramimonas_sp.AAC.1